MRFLEIGKEYRLHNIGDSTTPIRNLGKLALKTTKTTPKPQTLVMSTLTVTQSILTEYQVTI